MSKGWLEGLNRMNLNIVPNFVKETIERSKYDKMDDNTKQKVGEIKCDKPIEVLFEGAILVILIYLRSHENFHKI